MPTPEEKLKSCAVVIVTGASSGIGRALVKAIGRVAPELPRCNLSRTEPEDFSGRGDRHIPCDLRDPAAIASASETLRETLAELPEGEILLINNSGAGDYGPFAEADRERSLGLIDLNARAMVDLTARLVPELKRRGGCVMNIASTAAFQPTPYLSVYGATKAFALHWSLSLAEELRGTGASALAVCPGPTESNFFANAGFRSAPMPKGAGQTAEAVAAESLRAWARGRRLVVTGRRNKALSFVAGKLPRVVAARLAGAILRRFRSRD